MPTVVWTVLIVLVLVLPAPVLAQAPFIPPEADISRLRPPPLEIPPTPDFDLRIETPEQAPTPRAVDDLRFEVRDIRVDGMTHYSREQVGPILDPLLNRRIALQDLRDAAQAIEARYRADGFFLVRVFIPPQQVGDGVFTIQVIEGFIEAVYAEGADEGSRRIAERVAAPVIEQRPIDLPSLERALLLFNDYPGISGGGVLRPGTRLGASELVLALLEPQRAAFSFNVNNTASNLLGPWGFAASMLLNNPLPHPGQLSLGLVGSMDFDKLRSLNVRYASGFGRKGLVASMGAIVSQSRPSGLGIESESFSLAPRLRFPLRRYRDSSVYLEGGLTVNRSRSDLDGVRVTEDRATVGDLSLIWVDTRLGGGATQAVVGVSFGTDWFGTLGPEDGLSGRENFEPEFRKLTYSLQRVQAFSRGFGGVLSLRGQYTADRLVSGEQISFGGAPIGLGYDGGSIAGDRGFGAAVELRWDMPTLERLPLGPGGRIQWFLTADWAEVKRLDEASESIRSISLGGRYRNDMRWSIDGTIAYALDDDTAVDPRDNPRLLISTTRSF